jgi:4-hydroxy-tetrahydrodipicolinate reductase
MTTRLAIIGDGKMGRALRALADDAGFEVIAYLGKKEVVGGPSTKQLGNADIAVEFSVPNAAAANVIACARAGIPVVSGTTGWDDQRPAAEKAVLDAKGSLLWSPNFSIGVAIFARVVEQAARDIALTQGTFGAHVVETHHDQKQDAPSGTGKMLAARASAALGAPVPITSVRTGHVPGTHELIFDAAFEQIRLVHEARDRRVFAAGALAAARWLLGQKGIFTMNDFLGIR